MKIEEQTKVEIQQALGYAVPDPSAPGFAAFYSRLETEHPHLAAQLLAGLQHDEGEGGTDAQAFFPEQEAQARTRAQARGVLQRLFYRQDDLTDEWTLSKGKVGMAGLLGACLLIGPMLLAGAGGNGAAPTAAVPARLGTPEAPPPTAALPPPLAEPPAVDPLVALPPAETPLPAVSDAVPAPPPEGAPLPPAAEPFPVAQAVEPLPVAQAAVPLPVAQAALPAYDPAPVPVAVQAPPPIRPGATIFRAVRATADTSTTVYVSAARSGAPERSDAEKTGKGAGTAANDGLTVYTSREEVLPAVSFTVYESNKPGSSAPTTPQIPGTSTPEVPAPGPASGASAAATQPPGTRVATPAPPANLPAPGEARTPAGRPEAPVAAPLLRATAAYPVGTTLKAELVTGVIVAQGSQSMPMLARTDSGVIFSGLATLGEAGRLSIVFNNVLIGGRLESLSARAYDLGGLPGLPVQLREVAPSLAVDLTRAAASGVAGYVEQLGNQTETVIEGNTRTIIKVPPTLSNVIAGAVAKLFSSPPTQKALERIAQVDRGTPMLITVMGEGVPASVTPALQAP